MTENTYTWIKGNGQMVYWKDCKVTSYRTILEDRDNREVIAHKNNLTGQMKLPSGCSLYCVGGKVKMGLDKGSLKYILNPR